MTLILERGRKEVVEVMMMEEGTITEEAMAEDMETMGVDMVMTEVMAMMMGMEKEEVEKVLEPAV